VSISSNFLLIYAGPFVGRTVRN